MGAANADGFNIPLLDNAGAHTAQSLQLPANAALLFQSPRCPELNSTERVWKDLCGKLAWQRFTYIDPLEDELVARLGYYQPATLQSLTSYPYLLQAYHAACL